MSVIPVLYTRSPAPRNNRFGPAQGGGVPSGRGWPTLPPISPDAPWARQDEGTLSGMLLSVVVLAVGDGDGVGGRRWASLARCFGLNQHRPKAARNGAKGLV